MANDLLRFIPKAIYFSFGYLLTLAKQKVLAIFHRLSYTAVADPKNVVVVGASFAGVQVVKRLAQTLPTGYRVVVVEKNLHLNYLFAFPRFSVVPGYEEQAFLPYDGIAKGAPDGAYKHVQGKVLRVERDRVILENGEALPYAYLVIATGSQQPFPAKVSGTEKAEGCAELRGMQEKVKSAHRIAVVGGGAVGVEIATDIKSSFPEKDVMLVHSRKQLLPSFGPRLHEHVMKVLETLQVDVLLGERPQVSGEKPEGGNSTLTFSDGRTEVFDLIVSPPARPWRALTWVDTLHWPTSQLVRGE